MTNEKAAVGICPPFSGYETSPGLVSVPPSVTAKMRRQSMRKRGALAMAQVIREFGPKVEASEVGRREVVALANKVGCCASWLLFRSKGQQVTVGAGNFCKVHLICSSCAAVRARRHVQRYSERMATVPDVLPYHLTLTMPSVIGQSSAADGTTDQRSAAAAAFRAEREALSYGVETLLHGWRCLWERRKKYGGPFGCVSGAVVAVEVTRGPAGWHPHLHCLVLCKGQEQVPVVDLRSAWEKLTGGRQLRIDRVKGHKGLLECLKYSVKPMEVTKGEVDLEGAFWRLQAHQALSGRRLVFGYGSLYGVPEPDLDETENPGEDWAEWWARWSRAGKQYQIVSGVREAVHNPDPWEGE